MKHSCFTLACLFILTLVAQPSGLRAEKQAWTLISGDTISGEIIGFYAGAVFVDTGGGRTAYVPYSELAEEDQRAARDWLASFLKQRQEPRRMVGQSASRLSRFLAANLVTRESGAFASYDMGKRPEPEFYAFYYSAHWCGPCRRFTPRLREFYQSMRERGFDNFEIIFVSFDTSQAMMGRYMEEDRMPWPAVKFGKRGNRLVSRHAGAGIPCLVVTDREGRLLFHSYRGEEYLGPSLPMESLGDTLTSLKALEDQLQTQKSPES